MQESAAFSKSSEPTAHRPASLVSPGKSRLDQAALQPPSMLRAAVDDGGRIADEEQSQLGDVARLGELRHR